MARRFGCDLGHVLAAERVTDALIAAIEHQVKDPALVVRDEPTNGLDPHDIAEMRVLIRAVGR